MKLEYQSWRLLKKRVFLLISTIIFLSNDINLGRHKWGETHPALLRFVCHQWDVIHHSKFQYVLLTDLPMYWSLCIKIMCEVCKRQCFKSLCFYAYHLKQNKQKIFNQLINAVSVFLLYWISLSIQLLFSIIPWYMLFTDRNDDLKVQGIFESLICIGHVDKERFQGPCSYTNLT